MVFCYLPELLQVALVEVEVTPLYADRREGGPHCLVLVDLEVQNYGAVKAALTSFSLFRTQSLI